MVSGVGQVDRDSIGKMSSRKISGKWASAGTRLKTEEAAEDRSHNYKNCMWPLVYSFKLLYRRIWKNCNYTK